jgi:rhodanese-related sulfurtransferase
MTLSTVTPEKAKQLLNKGAILVDIREADERARRAHRWRPPSALIEVG